MGAPGDGELEDRVRVLEREVARLREKLGMIGHDAEAARVLAAGADHDVSEVRAELRAHTQALNALRETQLEQGNQIHGVRAEIDGVRSEVSGMRTEIDGVRSDMREGFATVNVGMTRITDLLYTALGDDQS